MITVQNLTKKYTSGIIANEDINLKINKNLIIGLVGSNGAGKTTLIRQIVGLLKPSSGCITYLNNDRPSELIAYFSQKSYMLEALKPFEVIYSTGIYRGLDKEEAMKQTNELLTFFNFNSNQIMSKMSGGQLKMVMLMATFIGKRPILIFDEPTNDLDPINREKLFQLIHTYNKNYGSTIIISSHNLTELEMIIDTVMIMKKGRLVYFDSLEKINTLLNIPHQITITATKSHLQIVKDVIKIDAEIKNNKLVIYKNDNIGDFLISIANLIEKYDLEIDVSKGSLQSLYLSLEGEK